MSTQTQTKPRKEVAVDTPSYDNTHMHGNGEALPSEDERRDTFGKPWRPQSFVEDNPVGLDAEVAEALIPILDEVQSSMWVMYHQYHKHHWLVEGPQFHDLHLFLEENYNDVHKYLDTIAERMTALGGIPTSDPVNHAKLSGVEHEPEGTYRVREMLEHDRAAEATLAKQLRAGIEKALELGDHGTKRVFEKALTSCEERAHHVDHYLGEDTLEYGLTADEPAA